MAYSRPRRIKAHSQRTPPRTPSMRALLTHAWLFLGKWLGRLLLLLLAVGPAAGPSAASTTPGNSPARCPRKSRSPRTKPASPRRSSRTPSAWSNSTATTPASCAMPAKAHGCVKAEFKVRADLDPTLRRGVFAEPGKSWNAWVRFSNGNAYPQFDSKNDARGMAIKLLDVPGENSCPAAAMTASRTSSCSTSRCSSSATSPNTGRTSPPRPTAKPGLLPQLEPRQLGTAPPADRPAHPRPAPDSPLHAGYNGIAVQAGRTQSSSASSRPGEVPGLPATEAEPGPAQLPPRRPVPATLHRPHPACYAFQVQRQDPAKYMPIEDTSVEWKESDAPFATIADIIVPAQDFDSREQNLFCDNLSFNPGTHCRSIGRSAGSTGCGRRFTSGQWV